MACGRARTSLLALVGALALTAALTSPSVADDKGDIQNQQNTVQSQLDAAQAQSTESSAALQAAVNTLNAANAQLATAQAQLNATRGQLAVAQAENARLEAALADAESRLAAATSEADAAEAQYEDSREQLSSFVVDNSMQGDAQLVAVSGMLAGQSPNEFVDQMSVNDSIANTQNARAQQLDADQVMLDVRRQQIQDLRDQISEQQAQAAANVATLETLTSQAEAQEASVQALVGQAASAQQQAQAAAAEDLAQVQALEAERSRLQGELQAIINQELAANRSSGGSSGSGSSASGGALQYPVNAPVTSSFGMRFHPVLHVWKLHDGTDFGVACGTPVRAAASGTIIQQYYNGAYGNRVILNNGVINGSSIITTYNHLSSFAVGTGSYVQAGQVIGYAGTTGYSTGCHLHFMVLQNGTAVNPMGWL